MKTFVKLLAMALVLIPIAVSAEVKTIISEGAYNMGDGETPLVAESRALLNAKRAAVEQAGTYVTSYSKVKNYQLTEDEIKVLSSGVMEVTVLDKKRTIVGDGFRFWVKIKALVNSDKMEKMAGKVKDKATLDDFKKIQAAYDQSQKEIEVLKKQLAEASGDRKKAVEVKISENEKRFQANEWYEKGANYYYGSTWKDNKEYDKALEAFTVAIAMDPTIGKAYALRGDCFRRDGNHGKALADFKKAAGLCTGECRSWDSYGLIYYCMEIGGAYYRKGDYRSAIEAFSIPAEIYDSLIDTAYRSMNNLYKWRGLSYYAIGQHDQAIKDYDKAFAVMPYLSQEEKGSVYTNRGLAYYAVKNIGQAIADSQKACDLGNMTGCRNLQSFRDAAGLPREVKTYGKRAEVRRDGRFIAYDNGTVLDTKTNLMWAAKDSGFDQSWQGAKSYCEGYREGGYTDWRLPTKDELAGLYDAGKTRPSDCRNSYAVHFATDLIKLTCLCAWASEAEPSDSLAYSYSFELGGVMRTMMYADSYRRALPVRSNK